MASLCPLTAGDVVAAVGHAAHDLLEVWLAGRGVLAGLALHDIVDAAEAEAARAHAGVLAARLPDGKI